MKKIVTVFSILIAFVAAFAMATPVAAWYIFDGDTERLTGSVVDFNSPFTFDVDSTLYTVVFLEGVEIEGDIIPGETAVVEGFVVEGFLPDTTTILATEIQGVELELDEYIYVEGTVVSSSPFTLDVGGTVYTILHFIDVEFSGAIIEGEIAEVAGFLQDATTILAEEVNGVKVEEGEGEGFFEVEIPIYVEGTVASSNPLTLEIDDTIYSVVLLDNAEIIGQIIEGENVEISGFLRDATTILAIEVVGIES